MFHISVPIVLFSKLRPVEIVKIDKQLSPKTFQKVNELVMFFENLGILRKLVVKSRLDTGL